MSSVFRRVQQTKVKPPAGGGEQPHGSHTFTATGSWECPADVYSLTLKGWGNGGPAGARRSSGPGGGGASAPCVESVITVVPGRTYNFAAGTLGIGGNQAANGGTTTTPATRATFTDSVTSTVVWAGAAGNYGIGGPSGAQGTGNTGDSVGDTITAGNPGVAGVGGSAPNGGGTGGTLANPGNPGGAPGAGGGTGLSGTGSAGGNGGRSELRLTW
jgi:hypothetical protein